MPIMDGYMACKKINSYFEFLNEEVTLKQNKQQQESVEIQRGLIGDLQVVVNEVIELHELDQSEAPEKIELIDKLLRNYEALKFRILDDSKRPLIFAYSSLVNDKVMKKTKKCGFERCYQAPINQDTFSISVLP